MEGPPLGQDPEQNLQSLQVAVAQAQAQQAAEAEAAAAALAARGMSPQEQAAIQGHMRHLMSHQEPALQTDDSLLELAEGADTKRCASCRIVKPVSEYYKDRTHSRGIKTRCKQCLRACKEAFKNQQRAKSAAEQVTVTQKKCSHCGQEKAAAEFSRSSYQRTGLRSWCKECSSKSKKQAKAEGRWKSYDSKSKIHQQRIEELIAMNQPRKCRKCDEIRQPEEFPADPRQPSRRLRECQYCLEAHLGQLSAAAVAADGTHTLPMSAWNSHLSEYWHLDPTRAQQLHNMAAAEALHQQPNSENIMRILQAMAGSGEDGRRMTPEMLSQLGVYPDPNDPISELAPEAQAAVIQQFMDQQRHHHLLHPQHPGAGLAGDVLYQRDAAGGLHYAGPQREPHFAQYGDHTPEHQAREDPTAQHEEDGQGQDADEKVQGGMTVGHFEQLRNVPYAGSLPQLNAQLQIPHHLNLHTSEWPSAFAPTNRQNGGGSGQGSPKRQRME